MMVKELVTGSVGICYERFFHEKQSIGIKSSAYLFGRGYLPLISYGRAEFTGIKLSPFYRFYYYRHERGGGYLEGKAAWGYFDFSELYYAYPNSSSYGDHYHETSNSLGLGISAGWMFRFYPDHLLMGISIGLQFLELKVPEKKRGDYLDLIYEVDDAFWYINGPGAVLEFKFMIGGVF